jgi:hypothetical protein
MFVARGPKGFGSPPVQLELEKLPFAAGSIPRFISVEPAELTFPLFVQSVSFEQLLIQMRSVRRWFDTGNENNRTPGYFRITTPDDVATQMLCYYAGGLEGDMDNGGVNWGLYPITLIGPSSYWTDIAQIEVEYTQANIGTLEVVMNAGDFEAQPIWTIQGPAAAMTFENLTTGKSMSFAGAGGLTIPLGNTLTIDTRLASERTTIAVYDSNGVNRFPSVNANGSLWWLRRGANTIRISALDTSASTRFIIRYTQKYRGALR